MQGRQDPRKSAEIFWITEEFDERVARTLEQMVGHPCLIETPKRIELVRNRKDDMVVVARKEPFHLLLPPTFYLNPRALRAASMLTRVVPHALDVTVLALLNVPSE